MWIHKINPKILNDLYQGTEGKKKSLLQDLKIMEIQFRQQFNK